ncbi:MAG: PAS domain S-box protein [Bacteroidota bacterium]
MLQPSLTDVLYDHLNLGLVFLEEDRIVECNAFFEEIIGQPSELLIGERLDGFLNEESAGLLSETMGTKPEQFNLTVQVGAPAELRWLRLSYKHNPEYSDDLRLFVVEDVTENHVKQLVFKRLSEGLIENDSQSIFSSIVLTLSEVFGVKYSFIGVCGQTSKEIEIRALSLRNELLEVPNLPLAKTPCLDVLTYGRLVVTTNVQTRYPLDEDLKTWDVDSYIGVSLRDREQKAIGHIAILDDKPLKDEELILTILELYSSRLAAELEKELQEQHLQQSESKYRSLFESAYEAKVVYDATSGRFLDVNKAACDLFGYSLQEFLTIDPMCLRTPYLTLEEAKVHLDRAVKDALKNGIFVEETHSTTKEELVIETEMTIEPLDADKRQVVISLRDITSRKKAERELESYRTHLEQLVGDRTSEIENLNKALMSTNEDLERTNKDLQQQTDELHSALNDLKLTQEQLIREEKMSSLGVLTSGIAHEINNSLNLIGGGMNQIKLEMEDLENLPEDHREEMEYGLEWINDGMQRVIGIVGGLSSYGQYRASIRKKVNLDELLESVISLHKTRMNEDIKLKIDLNTPCEIEIYVDHLHKALLNILDNATYFSSHCDRQLDSKEIEIRTQDLADEDKVLIEFRNYGDIIPEDIKSKIFDPFFTTKEPGQGIGLGLTVAYSFVKRHNGKIEAINHEDGVSFVLKIPKVMTL